MMCLNKMSKIVFPPDLEDKIFEIKYDSDSISKITSYFPFSDSEKQEINSILNMDFSGFHSIFFFFFSEEEWNRTKDQIKKDSTMNCLTLRKNPSSDLLYYGENFRLIAGIAKR